ncbi:hypothetical protein, partial [Pseudactinotalea sp.]|uniref:hypothetical protein n=1 Tax=Pseudactinotalea sp. TaxID=1926260 RepID=UPI003B3B715B
RLVPALVTPPANGAHVCDRCSTWTPNGRLSERACRSTHLDDHNRVRDRELTSILCENCLEVRTALDRDPLGLSVISLYRKPSPLRNALTRYKGREDDEDPFDPACVRLVRSMLGRYLMEHGESLLQVSGGIDGIVVVPSTERPAPHPLEAVVDSLELDLPRLQLLARGPGELGFRRPSPDGYRVVMTHAPSRILLLDDVYTTGSRLNSAACALEQSGHKTVAALVLARRINPDYSSEATQLWAAATTQAFDWKTSPRTVEA